MRVHPAIYHLFHFTIRLVLVLIFAGVPLALYFLSTIGIGFGVREELENALGNPTVEVRIGKLLLDPFHGLVAVDVAIREREQPDRLLAKLNRIEISLNLSELLQRRIIVDTLTLERAEASIPLGKGELAPRLEARDIHASIIVLGDRLRVSQLDGIIECLRIRLTGEILNPLAYQVPTSTESQPVLPPETLEKILSALREPVFPSGLPLLTAEFLWDASDPSSLEISDFELRSSALRARGFALKEIEIHGSFINERLRIPVFKVHDSKGSLQVSLEWDKTTGDLNASLLSGLDIMPFLNTFGKEGGALSKLT
ncbi:MAG: hypothetical protein ACO3FQ_02845, partial [Terrimicrobiaceae bacterium]